MRGATARTLRNGGVPGNEGSWRARRGAAALRRRRSTHGMVESRSSSGRASVCCIASSGRWGDAPSAAVEAPFVDVVHGRLRDGLGLRAEVEVHQDDQRHHRCLDAQHERQVSVGGRTHVDALDLVP